MKLPDKLIRAWRGPRLTRPRVAFAFIAAAAADAAQWFFGPIPLADQVIDVVAMLLTVGTLGFHPLLLPTFVVELIPGVDLLPTWTACVAAVVVLKSKAQRAANPEDSASS